MPEAIAEAIADFRPDLVLHPAALTDTAGCQRDPDLAYRVNALGTRNVALGCQRAGAALLYISTNEVFDGRKAEPYLEWEPVGPLSVYARSKQAGEWYVQRLLERYYIVRIAWLYGGGAQLLRHQDAGLGDARASELRVVTDEVATPTYVPDLVEAIVSLVRQPGLWRLPLHQRRPVLPLRLGAAHPGPGRAGRRERGAGCPGRLSRGGAQAGLLRAAQLLRRRPGHHPAALGGGAGGLLPSALGD